MGTLGTEELLAQRDWLIALAARLVRDQAERDDLVQETWLAALGQPSSEREDPRTWLGAILRNRWRFTRRTDRRRGEREATRGAPEPSPSAAELAEQAEQQAVLARVVLALAEPYRATVLLRYFGGLTARVIARREGVPEGTVRSRLKRGLDQLRAELDERGGKDGRAWALALVPLARLERAGSGASKLALAASAAVVCALAAAAWFFQNGQESAPLPELASLPTPEPPDRTSPAAARDELVPEPPEPPITMREEPGRLELAVLDVNYRPIGGATVRARGASDSTTIRTDAEGRCRLPYAWWQGRLLALRVQAEGFEHSDLDLSRGEISWDVPLPVLLTPTTRISGTVRDSRGAPLSGVELHALHDYCYEPLARATSDARGAFELNGVPRGDEIVVRVFAEGRAPTTRRIQVPSGAPSPLTIELAEATRVTGRVLDAWSGAPLAGARVLHTLNWHASGPESDAHVVATSDERGTLTLAVPDQEEEYLLVADGFCSTRVAPQGDGFELALLPMATLEGRVRTADGTPVAGLGLSIDGLMREARARQLDSAIVAPEVFARLGEVDLRLPKWKTTTDSEGRFQIGVLPAWETRLWLDRERVEHPSELPAVKLQPGATHPLEITLGELGSITGSLRVDGVPGPGRISFVRGKSSHRTVFARPDGTFELTGLLAGPLSLSAEPEQGLVGASGGPGARVDVDVHAGETVEVEFDVTPELASVHGHVRTSEGRGLPHRRVYARGKSSITGWNTFTGVEGEFELSVPREVETLVIGLEGATLVPVLFDGAPIEFIAPSFGRVRLSATGHDGRALDRVELFERRAGGKWRPLGAFSIDGDGFAEWVLEAGLVELAASKVEQGYATLLLGALRIPSESELVLRCTLERVEPVEF
ncbi:MAG: sigma-70 family RNA polymerase sigma factor, partial [Planctomycetota bacterium]